MINNNKKKYSTKHGKTFTKSHSAIALALVASLGSVALSGHVIAAQAEKPGQGGSKGAPTLKQPTELSAGFIIKFKKNSRLMNEVAQAASANGQARAAVVANEASRVARDLSSDLGTNLKFSRGMGLPAHFVFDSEKRMNAKQAERLLKKIQSHPQVESAEVNQLLRHFATPNDPQYSDQWHYYEGNGGLNAPLAWEDATGDGVVVAVLDTGFRPHADLSANLLPGYDMISDPFIGNDGNGRDSDASDPGDWVDAGACGGGYPAQDQSSSWHGTHVAGTIAAVTNNNSGVAGVAYDANVVPVRVLGRCGGTTADIADGIIWASGGNVSGVPGNSNPADVINMSLGGQGSCSSTTQQAINLARGNGSTVVIASGNSNANSSNFNPGNCNGVVNVAATNRDGGRSYYSNYGANVDVAAPGGAQQFANDPNGVLSTYNSGSTTPSSDSYSYSQGTSMAAPHVAGVAALIKEVMPSASPDDVESILKQTARSFPGSCNGCGTGIVDAFAAVDAAAGGGGDPGTPGDNELANGVVESNLSGATGSEVVYSLNVPSGASDLSFSMSGGSGDADLYVRFGSEPTSDDWDCRPYESGNNETCDIQNVQAGTYYVMVQGYSTYSGVSLVGEYTGGSTGGGSGGETYEDLSATTGNWLRYTVNIPAGTSSFDVTISGGSGDADLYLNYGSQPNTGTYDCRPYLGGNNESCSVSSPQAGTYHIGVRAYQSFSGLTLETAYSD